MAADTGVAPTVSDTASVEYRLEVEDLNGHPISTIAAGQDFQLVAFVRDIRSPALAAADWSAPAADSSGESGSNLPYILSHLSQYEGVFAGYLNVSYDPELISVAAGATLIHGDTLRAIITTGDLSTAGEIIGAGGATSSITSPGPSEQLLWKLTMHASGAGVVSFDPSFDSRPGYDTLVYGEDYRAFGASDIYVPATPLQLTVLASAGDAPAGARTTQTGTSQDTGQLITIPNPRVEPPPPEPAQPAPSAPVVTPPNPSDPGGSTGSGASDTTTVAAPIVLPTPDPIDAPIAPPPIDVIVIGEGDGLFGAFHLENLPPTPVMNHGRLFMGYGENEVVMDIPATNSAAGSLLTAASAEGQSTGAVDKGETFTAVASQLAIQFDAAQTSLTAHSNSEAAPSSTLNSVTEMRTVEAQDQAGEARAPVSLQTEQSAQPLRTADSSGTSGPSSEAPGQQLSAHDKFALVDPSIPTEC